MNHLDFRYEWSKRLGTQSDTSLSPKGDDRPLPRMSQHYEKRDRGKNHRESLSQSDLRTTLNASLIESDSNVFNTLQSSSALHGLDEESNLQSSKSMHRLGSFSELSPEDDLSKRSHCGGPDYDSEHRPRWSETKSENRFQGTLAKIPTWKV